MNFSIYLLLSTLQSFTDEIGSVDCSDQNAVTALANNYVLKLSTLSTDQRDILDQHEAALKQRIDVDQLSPQNVSKSILYFTYSMWLHLHILCSENDLSPVYAWLFLSMNIVNYLTKFHRLLFIFLQQTALAKIERKVKELTKRFQTVFPLINM